MAEGEAVKCLSFILPPPINFNTSLRHIRLTLAAI